MATPQAAFERRTTRRHTAIVLVGALDRRVLPALRFASRLPDTEVRALHISVEPARARRLANDWMELGLGWLPLHIHDAAAETLLASVRQAVEREADQAASLTVVVPELDFYRWWHPLLHRRSARRIAQHLQSIPGVTTVIVPFSPPLRASDHVAPARRQGGDRDLGSRTVGGPGGP